MIDTDAHSRLDISVPIRGRKDMLQLMSLHDPGISRTISDRLRTPGMWGIIREMLAKLSDGRCIPLATLGYILANPQAVKIIKSTSHAKNLRTLIMCLDTDINTTATDEVFLPAAMHYLDNLPNAMWGQFDTKTATKILVYVNTQGLI